MGMPLCWEVERFNNVEGGYKDEQIVTVLNVKWGNEGA